MQNTRQNYQIPKDNLTELAQIKKTPQNPNYSSKWILKAQKLEDALRVDTQDMDINNMKIEIKCDNFDIKTINAH